MLEASGDLAILIQETRVSCKAAAETPELASRDELKKLRITISTCDGSYHRCGNMHRRKHTKAPNDPGGEKVQQSNAVQRCLQSLTLSVTYRGPQHTDSATACRLMGPNIRGHIWLYFGVGAS